MELWKESFEEGKGRILVARADIQPNQSVLEDTALLR